MTLTRGLLTTPTWGTRALTPRVERVTAVSAQWEVASGRSTSTAATRVVRCTTRGVTRVPWRVGLRPHPSPPCPARPFPWARRAPAPAGPCPLRGYSNRCGGYRGFREGCVLLTCLRVSGPCLPSCSRAFLPGYWPRHLLSGCPVLGGSLSEWARTDTHVVGLGLSGLVPPSIATRITPVMHGHNDRIYTNR